MEKLWQDCQKVSVPTLRKRYFHEPHQVKKTCRRPRGGFHTRKVYTFVPTQNWNRKWTDENLYAKYDISASEIAFIEKVARPMELSGAFEDD